MKWNQASNGNACVFDGSERYWAEFPAGTTAESVLDDYLDTSDYSCATADFVVQAEIGGQVAQRLVRASAEPE